MPPRRTTALPALALLLTVALTGCGGEEDTTGTDPEASPSSAEPSTSATSESPSETPSETAAEDGTRVEIVREGDTITPNGERVEISAGEPITLVITSDTAGELHVHTTPEQDIAYGSGTSEHELTIERPGVVEVESHDPDLVVLQLEAR
jgi:hypothetical protein